MKDQRETNYLISTSIFAFTILHFYIFDNFFQFSEKSSSWQAVVGYKFLWLSKMSIWLSLVA